MAIQALWGKENKGSGKASLAQGAGFQKKSVLRQTADHRPKNHAGPDHMRSPMERKKKKKKVKKKKKQQNNIIGKR